MPSRLRPKWSSKNVAEPVGAKPFTPRMRIGHGRIAHDRLGDRGAEAAFRRRLFRGDDRSRLARRRNDRRLVQRLDGRDVDHPRFEAMPRKRLGRIERAADDRARGDDGQRRSLAQHVGPSEGEGVRFIEGDVRDLRPSNPQIGWKTGFRRPAHRGARLRRIGRHDDRQPVDRPQPAQVLDRMVGRPELAVGHAGTHSAEHDRKAIVGDVDLDLLERAAGQKRRRAAKQKE